MKRARLIQAAATLATAAFILFIFSNSLQNGEESGNRSQSVLATFQRLFARAGIPFAVTEYFIRKAAHFLEYFALGLLLMGALRAYTPKLKRYCAIPLCLGFMVACCGEALQRFVPGRSGQFSDVLLDFSGVAAGALSLMFFILWKQKRRRQKRPCS